MNKKESILRSALKLITENGIHATPMSAVAKEAGTGMGTIYNHYPNKDVLVNEIYCYIKKEEEGLFEKFSSEKPIKTQFETYYKTSVNFFIENPTFFRFMEQLHASPMITEESRREGENAVVAIIDLVESGKKNRILKYN